jgi:hypothetical protein
VPDRYALTLGTALASNTGGPYTATWDRVVVTSAGQIRSVAAVASSLSSNARQNSVEIYLQPDASAAGSNTAATVLVAPITLSNNNSAAFGTIRAGNPRVAIGDQLHLRTYADTVAATPAFIGLTASVEIERD